MFKHILLATDGSAAAEAMTRSCMAFAAEMGAEVTGIHVVPVFHLIGYQSAMVVDSREQEREHNAELARSYLHEVLCRARALGVRCDTLFVEHAHPHVAIVSHALQFNCDLICVAAHGHGLRKLLLGSETLRILEHSPVPVLVYR